MQGRLSPVIGGKIQCFPWPYWREEFVVAQSEGWSVMEWTLDAVRLHENPLMTTAGRREIRALCSEYGVAVPSVTGDCFMQAPFFKAEGRTRRLLLDDLVRVLESCADLRISLAVVPLVDNASLEDSAEEAALITGMEEVAGLLRSEDIRVLFELDLSPTRARVLMDQLDEVTFGINYDIGNSAALGYERADELAAYGHRIVNVHVKDRVIAGDTVPLGTGAADLPGTLRALREHGYRGRYILQTARAADGDHVGALRGYRTMVTHWLTED
jgi:hexulose-6-phosphate isomerase